MKTKKRTAAEVLASTVYSMSMPFVSAFSEDKNEHLSADISGFESVCRQKLMLENSRENKLRRIMKDAADAVSPMKVEKEDIYTDPKAVYTVKDVELMRNFLHDEAMEAFMRSSDCTDTTKFWDAFDLGRMNIFVSSYGH